MEEARKGNVRVVAKVPLVDGLRTPYHQFRDKFMRPNLPVLVSGLMDGWRAFREWFSPSGTPNLDHLASVFGKSIVQVAECSIREFTDQKRVNMTVADYIAYWKLHNSDKLGFDGTNSLLYLKDWHFVKDYPDYDPYSTPVFFMDDWLNFYSEHHRLHVPESQEEIDGCLSDYRFVYMGPKGTWTPLHADVYRSYSWSGNICGRKLWHLLPPSQTHLILDRHMRSSIYDIYADVRVEEFPNFNKAGWLECIQERGQILFVPSGWYHQVTNLEDTISINHNWFNGYNLHCVWQLLLADYEETKASIEDIRLIADNFEELCQRNLAANSGMNFYDFFVFLRRMMEFFLSYLCNSSSRDRDQKVENGMCFSSMSICSGIFTQVLFSLQSIHRVAKLLASTQTYQKCMLTLPPSLQMVKSDGVAGWLDDAQHSEYTAFLSNLCPCMSGACFCADPLDLQGVEIMHSKTSGVLVLHGNPPIIQYHDADAIGSICDIEAKVKTPKALVQVIEAAMRHFIHTCRLNA